MTHISGHDRSQTLLLPESPDEYVGPNNPVRFIDAFMDGLDLTAAGFIGAKPKMTGRPGYAPKDLLKLYIDGYRNRVRSSRWLEGETHRNIEVTWLLRHLKPDFKTSRSPIPTAGRTMEPSLPACATGGRHGDNLLRSDQVANDRFEIAG
jgi:transposase